MTITYNTIKFPNFWINIYQGITRKKPLDNTLIDTLIKLVFDELLIDDHLNSGFSYATHDYTSSLLTILETLIRLYHPKTTDINDLRGDLYHDKIHFLLLDLNLETVCYVEDLKMYMNELKIPYTPGMDECVDRTISIKTWLATQPYRGSDFDNLKNVSSGKFLSLLELKGILYQIASNRGTFDTWEAKEYRIFHKKLAAKSTTEVQLQLLIRKYLENKSRDTKTQRNFNTSKGGKSSNVNDSSNTVSGMDIFDKYSLYPSHYLPKINNTGNTCWASSSLWFAGSMTRLMNILSDLKKITDISSEMRKIEPIFATRSTLPDISVCILDNTKKDKKQHDVGNNWDVFFERIPEYFKEQLFYYETEDKSSIVYTNGKALTEDDKNKEIIKLLKDQELLFNDFDKTNNPLVFKYIQHLKVDHENLKFYHSLPRNYWQHLYGLIIDNPAYDGTVTDIRFCNPDHDLHKSHGKSTIIAEICTINVIRMKIRNLTGETADSSKDKEKELYGIIITPPNTHSTQTYFSDLKYEYSAKRDFKTFSIETKTKRSPNFRPYIIMKLNLFDQNDQIKSNLRDLITEEINTNGLTYILTSVAMKSGGATGGHWWAMNRNKDGNYVKYDDSLNNQTIPSISDFKYVSESVNLQRNISLLCYTIKDESKLKEYLQRGLGSQDIDVPKVSSNRTMSDVPKVDMYEPWTPIIFQLDRMYNSLCTGPNVINYDYSINIQNLPIDKLRLRYPDGSIKTLTRGTFTKGSYDVLKSYRNIDKNKDGKMQRKDNGIYFGFSDDKMKQLFILEKYFRALDFGNIENINSEYQHLTGCEYIKGVIFNIAKDLKKLETKRKTDYSIETIFQDLYLDKKMKIHEELTDDFLLTKSIEEISDKIATVFSIADRNRYDDSVLMKALAAVLVM